MFAGFVLTVTVRDAIGSRDEAVNDEKRLLTRGDCTREGVIKLSLGRKRHVLLKPR